MVIVRLFILRSLTNTIMNDTKRGIEKPYETI